MPRIVQIQLVRLGMVPAGALVDLGSTVMRMRVGQAGGVVLGQLMVGRRATHVSNVTSAEGIPLVYGWIVGSTWRALHVI